jgi:hypothetical protein
MPEGSSGSGANPLHDFCFKLLFFETGRFKRKKTVQFSGLPLVAKNGRSSKVVRDFGYARRGITAGK